MLPGRKAGAFCRGWWWLFTAAFLPLHAADAPVQVWRTIWGGERPLESLPAARFVEAPPGASAARPGSASITVDDRRQYQVIEGMGASFEASTCYNLSRLSRERRREVLERLLSPDRGIGMNLMRVCIGSSDFTGDPWYSYDDLPAGQTDPELRHFTIDPDRAYILPVLKEALRINPKLRFFASAWSPPGWMKSTDSLIGGRLLPRHYAAYAEYLAHFIQAYAAEGVVVEALTVQNEPGVDRARAKDPKWHYPSCHWTGGEEAEFIRDHLGPTLRNHRLHTRIWCYDHNYNEIPTEEDAGLDHPRAILADARAAAYVDGVAFHGYSGKASGMTRFHDEHPRTPIHFTEGSVFGVRGGMDLLERLRNWATSYNAWVVMLDERGKPNNGPFAASTAILARDTRTGAVKELFEYSLYGHFMKFIRPGAVRVESSDGDADLGNVAVRNKDGTLALVIVNAGKTPKTVDVRWRGRACAVESPAGSLITCSWRGAR